MTNNNHEVLDLDGLTLSVSEGRSILNTVQMVLPGLLESLEDGRMSTEGKGRFEWHGKSLSMKQLRELYRLIREREQAS